MPKKIYISSTFRDLEQYRAYMIDTLTFLCREGYFDLVRTMEYMMPGSSQPPLNDCKDDVDKCDIYLLIIGKNYGSIEQTTNLSFTENEYVQAKQEKKIILPFFADENAEGLAQFKTDDIVNYERFKGVVGSEKTRFVKKFTNPYHLSTQVLLALYQFSEKKWDTKEDVLFFCDRKGETRYFFGKKKRDKLNIFTLTGNVDDKADYFVKRLGKYEFGLPDYTELRIRAVEFRGRSNNYEKHKQILLSHLLNWNSVEENMPDTVEKCFDYLKSKNKNTIFINIYLSKSDVGDSILKKTLQAYFAELKAACTTKQIAIFYFIIFEFENNEEINDQLASWISEDSNIKSDPANVWDLEVLSDIGPENVRDWLEAYVFDVETGSANLINRATEFVGNYYQNNQRIKMQQTFVLLKGLLKEINKIN